jgi:transposase
MTEERLILTDAAWQEIATLLARVKHRAGSPPKHSDRMCLEAVLSVARTGVPWRDLPTAFGKWDAVYNCFRRWEQRGIWQQLWHNLQADEFTVARHIFMDSTMIRAHQHAAGALKKTAGKQHRLWAVLAEAFPRQSLPAVWMKREASLWGSREAKTVICQDLTKSLIRFRKSMLWKPLSWLKDMIVIILEINCENRVLLRLYLRKAIAKRQ